MENLLPQPIEPALLVIAQRIGNGEKVSSQEKLKYLHWQEKTLAAQIKDDPGAYLAQLDILAQIKAVDDEIKNSGDLGGSMISEASRRDAHNNPW